MGIQVELVFLTDTNVIEQKKISDKKRRALIAQSALSHMNDVYTSFDDRNKYGAPQTGAPYTRLSDVIG